MRRGTQPIGRRRFLEQLGLTGIAAGLCRTGFAQSSSPSSSSNRVIKPPRLRPGDTVGLIDPASATFLREDLDIATESLAAMGLRVKPGAHLLDRYGYFAGKDDDRASDINTMFADPSVRAIFALRGGWGSSRLLPLLDYETIRRNPKILLGYSDITALHLAISARTGLVTFHGPVASSEWNPFNVDHVKRVLFGAEQVVMANPQERDDQLTVVEHRVQTIAAGKARGRIFGGNLTVLATIIGSGYLPDFTGAILFLEDVGEKMYRIDRMLTQLALAGVLKGLRGFVFGKCTECEPGEGYGSLTFEEVLADHIRPLGIPAWRGAMIGHKTPQFTIPEGIEVEIDAGAGTIQMLEPAVV